MKWLIWRSFWPILLLKDNRKFVVFIPLFLQGKNKLYLVINYLFFLLIIIIIIIIIMIIINIHTTRVEIN